MISLKTFSFFLLSVTTMSHAVTISQPEASQNMAPKPHQKYRNIIFDMGLVLVDWDPKKAIEKIFQNRVSSKTDVPYKLVEATQSPLWHEYDRGTISEQELVPLISSTYDIPHSDAALFVYYAPKALVPLELGQRMFDGVKKLGFKIYLLTNLSSASFAELSKTTSFFTQADGYVASFEINKIKPEPEIYRTLIKKYNLLPEECLFIDDKPENIKAGKEEHGIDGIICNNHPDTIEALKQKGIIIE